MSHVSMLSQEEWEKLFDERNHNPPPPDADFSNEFDAAIHMIERFLLRHAPAEDFQVWDKHNRARFIDVAFQSEAYLQPALVKDIQQWLRTLLEDWMVVLWETRFLFVTRDEVLCFAPIPDDPAVEGFVRARREAA